MCLKDVLHRTIACIVLSFRWRKYDVLIVDSSVTALLLSLLSMGSKGNRKLVINNFNVPRRRTGLWRWIERLLFHRVDFFFAHSRRDIPLASELYNIEEQRLAFRPIVRTKPTSGNASVKYLFEDKRPFVMSYGGNARDYTTFFEAIEGTNLNAIVVARQYNIKDLRAPDNVRVFCNIPLAECDKLVRECEYTVFTFDGSEPSCGQVSIVTSFLLGKPVICTDWVGIADYVSDGINGMLVKMSDVKDLRTKMVELFENQQLRSRLSAGASLWARDNCDISAAQSKVDDLVTKLTAANS